MREITVSEHTNGELREYSLYTIFDRAIPAVDGLKPSQRKALYSATKACANKKIKTIALGGVCFQNGYHHGDMSINACITQLASSWSNNACLLDGEGSFGSRLVQEAASPRYTSVSLSKNFSKYFIDTEICPVDNDPDHPEPIHYLPLVPWVLINGAKGIATGFACHILPRSINDVGRRCINMLHKHPTSPVTPFWNNFNGKVYQDGSGWICEGLVSKSSPTKIVISELPIGYDREKYIVVLDSLKEKGELVSYVDECSKHGFQFTVTIPRSAKNLSEKDLIKKFKLTKKYTENLTVIDSNGELKQYDSVNELISDFVEYRLTMFSKRYAYRIARDEKKRLELLERVRFCDLVVDNTIVFNSTKTKLLSLSSKLKFSKEHREKFVDMPLHNLTTDAIARYNKEIKALNVAIKEWKSIDCRKQYIKELEAIGE